MTWALWLSIAGLAALDAFNPATILGVALILLLPGHRNVLTALVFVVGAFATVLAIGSGVYFAAETAASAVEGGLVWLRRLAFGLAALAVFRSAVSRLKDQHRKALALPAWLRPATAMPLGVLLTAADLPNAFPYFIAIERLVGADVDALSALVVLAVYSAIYCTPCILLLVAGAAYGSHVRDRLSAVYKRFGSERYVKRNRVVATFYFFAAVALCGVAVTA